MIAADDPTYKLEQALNAAVRHNAGNTNGDARDFLAALADFGIANEATILIRLDGRVIRAGVDTREIYDFFRIGDWWMACLSKRLWGRDEFQLIGAGYTVNRAIKEIALLKAEAQERPHKADHFDVRGIELYFRQNAEPLERALMGSLLVGNQEAHPRAVNALRSALLYPDALASAPANAYPTGAMIVHPLEAAVITLFAKRYGGDTALIPLNSALRPEHDSSIAITGTQKDLVHSHLILAAPDHYSFGTLLSAYNVIRHDLHVQYTLSRTHA